MVTTQLIGIDSRSDAKATGAILPCGRYWGQGTFSSYSKLFTPPLRSHWCHRQLSLSEMIHGLRFHVSMTLPTPDWMKMRGKGPCARLLHTPSIPILPQEASGVVTFYLQPWRLTYRWCHLEWHDLCSSVCSSVCVCLRVCVSVCEKGIGHLCVRYVYAYGCVSVCV